MNKIQKEKLKTALLQKFGSKIDIHPLEDWNEEKEQTYLQQVSAMLQKENSETIEKVDDDTVVVTKLLIENRNKTNNCGICGARTKTTDDDVCFIKHQTCYKCFILHIEGRNTHIKTKENKEE